MEERLELTRPDQVKALMHPLRQQILERLHDGPATPSEVARALGMAANKVHYHVRILEKAGIVHLVETRQVGSVTELYFAMVARIIQIKLQDADGRAYMADGLSLIDGEVKALLADLRKAAARDQTAPVDRGLIILSRLHADSDGQQDLEDGIRSLQERFAENLERYPGRKLRLAIALVPMDLPDEED